MKKILTLSLLFILFIGCTRETFVENPYPRTEVFEVTANFTPFNGFQRLVPLNPPLFSSDVVLVYILWDFDGNAPIWRLMPQTVQWDLGDFIYNYDFTVNDVNLFLEAADFDLIDLGPEWVSNQRFRIVILPGFFAQANTLDYQNYDSVIGALQSNFDVNFKTLD